MNQQKYEICIAYKLRHKESDIISTHIANFQKLSKTYVIIFCLRLIKI